MCENLSYHMDFHSVIPIVRRACVHLAYSHELDLKISYVYKITWISTSRRVMLPIRCIKRGILQLMMFCTRYLCLILATATPCKEVNHKDQQTEHYHSSQSTSYNKEGFSIGTHYKFLKEVILSTGYKVIE